MYNKFNIGSSYRISGKLYFFSNTFQFIHPYEVINEKNLNIFEELEPQYNLARKKINKKYFRKVILESLKMFKNISLPTEWINKKIIKKNKWEDFKNSLINIHTPIKKSNDFRIYRERLAYDELLSNFLIFDKLKKNKKKRCNFYVEDRSLSQKIIKSLEFELTKDQQSTVNEIKDELLNQKQIYRLIQGDVGSGKTIVSLLVIADVINSGYQCVLMAPTELLAKQHFNYFKEIFDKYKIHTELLTSKSKKRKSIIEKVSENKIQLLIGTHSVYNKSLNFKNLGLVVIDEQHKFGVNQRIKLLEKSKNCHMLIMSATPIPRSLSIALYGEIDVSIIKSKPKNRKKVITSIISKKNVNNLIKGIERKIKKNEQVFWILPHIGSEEELEENENETVLSRFNYLKNIFKDKVSLIHGKMTDEKIIKNMEDFKNGKKMILISTTMVEVGINIPSATLMVIEEANKFGLAQLHQLRGRISRSNKQSNCVLMHNQNLSEISLKKLLILRNNDDGFEISEKDMFLRGSGDFFGTNQSGLPKWKFFLPYEDIHFLHNVKNDCKILLNDIMANKPKIDFLINTFYGEKEFLNFFSA
ncbi:MAG: ATP-dependent DNA helicase RecG [Rickettsiales bacterium]|nr:ATP-dependent DNA helicase RecG [Rickettsiales bacterium]RPG12637.1 MAG: DEAD/DEAH box helicase [Pelagibacteraceae bacterium TMED195]